eukprot:5576525-Pleurochrysis_carterae.AAC.1
MTKCEIEISMKSNLPVPTFRVRTTTMNTRRSGRGGMCEASVVLTRDEQAEYNCDLIDRWVQEKGLGESAMEQLRSTGAFFTEPRDAVVNAAAGFTAFLNQKWGKHGKTYGLAFELDNGKIMIAKGFGEYGKTQPSSSDPPLLACAGGLQRACPAPKHDSTPRACTSGSTAKPAPVHSGLRCWKMCGWWR